MLTLLMITLADLPDDPTPEDGDVVAGPIGAVVVVLLILAVVFLLFSFTKQMRKTQSAKEAGVFGEDARDDAADENGGPGRG
jgi:hypothetical protein